MPLCHPYVAPLSPLCHPCVDPLFCPLSCTQLLGIILSCLFWNLLVEMSESADMVDFRLLKKAGFEYSELDLSGAGWCLCLPRDGGYLPVPASEPDTWAQEPAGSQEALPPAGTQLDELGTEPDECGPQPAVDEVDNQL